MAVLPMRRISIYGLKKERKQLLELLQRRGVVEISDAIPEDRVFRKTDVSVMEDKLQKNLAVAKEALQILDTYLPEKKSILDSLNGRKEVSPELYDSFRMKYESVVATVNRIRSLNKEILEARAELLKLQAYMEVLHPGLYRNPAKYLDTGNGI